MGECIDNLTSFLTIGICTIVHIPGLQTYGGTNCFYKGCTLQDKTSEKVVSHILYIFKYTEGDSLDPSPTHPHNVTILPQKICMGTKVVTGLSIYSICCVLNSVTEGFLCRSHQPSVFNSPDVSWQLTGSGAYRVCVY